MSVTTQTGATWARLSDGSWGVRYEGGLPSDMTVTVNRKDGTTSRVLLTQALGDGLYVARAVEPRAPTTATMIVTPQPGEHLCACGRAIKGTYRQCYQCAHPGAARRGGYMSYRDGARGGFARAQQARDNCEACEANDDMGDMRGCQRHPN
jgi:hypothetical protein